MLSTATCVACQFPLSPEDTYCPRCGRPVSLLASNTAAGDSGPVAQNAPAAPASNGSAAPGPRLQRIAPIDQAAERTDREQEATNEGKAPAGTTGPAAFRISNPPARVQQTEVFEPVTNDDSDHREAPTAAIMPPAPTNGGSMTDNTGSLPVRPAAEQPRMADPAPRPWDPGPLPGSAPEGPAAAPLFYSSAPAEPAPAPAPLLFAAQPAPAAQPIAAPAVATANTAGALVMLPGEELVMQLGALYLTSRRAILYAPTILRAAFLRDVDAIGTLTERSSGWIFFLALLMLVLSGAGVYSVILQRQVSLLGLSTGSLFLIIIPLAILGIILLVTYFFWIKRSLFLSVGGRPLIVVSISAWNQRKLESVDGFVNAFSQAKDAIERESQAGNRL